jgi:hypothetical protein
LCYPCQVVGNGNFADNWHKWHKNDVAIAEIACGASLWDANFAILVIFRNLSLSHLRNSSFPIKTYPWVHVNILGVEAADWFKRTTLEPGSPIT